MPSAKEILDRQFLEMRWRCLSLAADFDRIDRAQGAAAVADDPRLRDLRRALEVILSGKSNRAEQFLNLFSDKTPPPNRKSKI